MLTHLRLALFCSLLALPLHAETTVEPPLRPGILAIELTPTTTSYLPLDSHDLQSSLCSGDPGVDVWVEIHPAAECDLSVRTQGGRLGFDVIEVTFSSADRTWKAKVQPTDQEPWESAAPVATPCGLWDVAFGLAAEEVQPESTLTLASSAETPGQGVFSGILEIAGRYRFIHQGSGHVREAPIRLALGLAGNWASLPWSSPDLSEETSNLVPFGTNIENEVIPTPGCTTWIGTRCRVCLGPGPSLSPSLH